jgi:hypothetical protein
MRWIYEQSGDPPQTWNGETLEKFLENFHVSGQVTFGKILEKDLKNN